MISEKEFRRRKKISDTLKENSYWKGKKLTKKHIQKITENHWDKKDTEDVKKIKEKISEKTKIGMDKPEVKEKLRNQFLGTTLTTELIQKIKDALNFPEIKKKHIDSYTIEIRKKISDRVKNAFINNPNLREISRRTLTKLMKNKKFRQKSIYSIRNTSPTKPEIVVDNILKKHNLGFEFVGNGKFWINYKNNNFNPDFINKKNKTIIEVFGWYWHSSEESKIRDTLRIEAYKKYGYKILVIWIPDKINNQQIENKILELVKNG